MSRPKYINSVKSEGRRWTDEDFEERGQKEDQLLKFLKNARCEECYKRLKENKICFEDLKFLKEGDVMELEFPIGLRNRLLNALEGLEGEGEAEDGIGSRLKEILNLVGEIAKTQVGMMEMIRKCQIDIAELQVETQVEEPRRRETFSATSPKVERVRKPTLSSIAKQNVIPNKYMQVSPLRASYYSRLMN